MKTATKPKVGDHILYLGRVHGTLIAIKKGMLKYEIRWDSGRSEHYSQKEWNRGDFELCGSSTSVVASAPVSLWQDYNLNPSTSSHSVSVMSGVNQSSSSDSQQSQSTTTLEGLQLVIPSEEFSSLQPVPLANPSRCRDLGKEPTINATVSQQDLKRSRPSDLNTSALKTSLDFLAVPTPQESQDPISTGFYKKFPSAGMMQSGSWSVQDTLRPPGADKDCFWLESPGALSSLSSRSPGQSRSEAQLKKLGAIQKGECIDPKWLEKKFNLPVNWTNPSEYRPATELLEQDEPPSEIVSIPELPLLPSSESSISVPSPKRKRSQNLKPASGSLSACTTMKKGKPYVSYQYSYDVRDADTKRGWRTLKVGVPRHKKEAIANLINQGLPVAEILEALRK